MIRRHLAGYGLTAWLLAILGVMAYTRTVNLEIIFINGVLGLLFISMIISPAFAKPRYLKKMSYVKITSIVIFFLIFGHQILVQANMITPTLVPIAGIQENWVQQLALMMPTESGSVDPLRATFNTVGFLVILAGIVIILFEPGIPRSKLRSMILAQPDDPGCSIPTGSVFVRNDPEREVVCALPITADNPDLAGDYRIVSAQDRKWAIYTPRGALLLRMLETDSGLVLPTDEKKILIAVKEVLEITMEIASHANAERAGNQIVVLVHTDGKFLQHLAAGGKSRTYRDTYRDVYASVISGLVACMIVKGKGGTCKVEKVRVVPETMKIELTLSWENTSLLSQ